MTEYARRAARVLLVDRAERILLFSAPFEEHGGAVGWFTVGGGVEPGEALVAAAARELAEETGLRVTPDALGPVVAYGYGRVDLSWAQGVFRDDYFYLRVDAHDVDVSGFQSEEAAAIVGHRWWPLAELESTDAIVYPFGLADLLRRLAAGEMPEEPERLPWHHGA